MPDARYVLAVKRTQRLAVPADWLHTLGNCPGACVLAASSSRALVTLSDQGLHQVRQQLGQWLHIEPETPHRSGSPELPDPPDQPV